MSDVLTPGVQVGTVGLLLLLLIRTYWRQGASWERIVVTEREAVTQAREDAAAARREAAELRDLLERTEEKCRRDIAALRRRLDDLEGRA